MPIDPSNQGPGAEITRLLAEAHDGRREALDQVAEIVHRDLERLAAKHIRARYGKAPKAVTLEPAAVVNETYLLLIRQRKRYDSRGHFFAIATRLMMRVLMNYDRSKRRRKRGGDLVRVSLSGVAEAAGGEEPTAKIADFVDALERLERLDARSAEVAKLRLIWGLTPAEISQTIGASRRTAEREWRFARSWLADELAPAPPS
jgi:RNA polymerase sigma factor (TIGR02999 family)